MVTTIQRRLNPELQLSALFKSPTAAALAGYLEIGKRGHTPYFLLEHALLELYQRRRLTLSAYGQIGGKRDEWSLLRHLSMDFITRSASR